MNLQYWYANVNTFTRILLCGLGSMAYVEIFLGCRNLKVPVKSHTVMFRLIPFTYMTVFVTCMAPFTYVLRFCMAVLSTRTLFSLETTQKLLNLALKHKRLILCLNLSTKNYCFLWNSVKGTKRSEKLSFYHKK